MHLGLIGYGNIAWGLTDLLAEEPLDRLTVLVRPGTVVRTRQALAGCRAAERCQVTGDLSDLLSDAPDLVAECAGHGAVSGPVPQVLQAGVPVIVVSVGALADDALARSLHQAAEAGGAPLILPAGAIGGIDLLSALAPAGDLSVRYQGVKPPAAWLGTAAEASLDLDRLDAPTAFFNGSAREAALTYPKNANVAATLALAGAGLDATRVELIADPAATGNRHSYEVTSPVARFRVQIDNAASGGNAKTSMATIYSLLREINRRRRPVVI